MRHYRPLFLSEIQLRMPGVHIRRLRLNRHLPDADALDEHRHPFAQILACLGGAGEQVIASRPYPASAGSVFFVPAGAPHAFRDTAARRPLFLVVDLDWRGAGGGAAAAGRIAQGDLSALRERLSALCRLDPGSGTGENRLLPAVHVLAVCEILLRSAGLLRPVAAPAHPLARKVEKALSRDRLAAVGAAEIARELGYQRDHLNRLLKSATGSTLGQLRAARLLAQARALLAQGARAGETAERLGFNDQNYFARWFRKQTGHAPTEMFRRAKGGKDEAAAGRGAVGAGAATRGSARGL